MKYCEKCGGELDTIAGIEVCPACKGKGLETPKAAPKAKAPAKKKKAE